MRQVPNRFALAVFLPVCASSDTGTFKIRLALAGVLLLTIILLDQKGKCFAGISMDQVLHYVTDVDYGTYLETWVETAVNGSQAL